MNKKYIIYARPFNIDSGGAIVLHLLCHLLNKNGYEAYLWPIKPEIDKKRPIKSLIRLLKYELMFLSKMFKTNKSFNTPHANLKDLEDSIVIYPEIVYGNPLNAKNVVRWLLHKPGFHKGKFYFGNNELLFGFGKPCSGSGIEITEENTLIIKYIMTDIYKQTNFSERKGSCHMIRKGKNKPFIHDENSVLVDQFSHEELQKIFNQVKYFISYDTYTYYSVYASLCGCISIIVPDEGVSKEEWYPEVEDRYGKAYGLNDINYSIETKQKMLEYIESQKEKNNISVKYFVNKCNERFNT